jgi:hypothetical protein
MHGKILPRRVKIVTWLDGVVDAMEKQELEDPMHKSWDLNSRPEDRVVDRKDRPLDEWNGMIMRRNLRGRTPEVHRDLLGSVSER